MAELGHPRNLTAPAAHMDREAGPAPDQSDLPEDARAEEPTAQGLDMTFSRAPRHVNC
ncbi:hypothetical protein GCM10009610_22770 [Pseudonocardia xinjiangensis]